MRNIKFISIYVLAILVTNNSLAQKANWKDSTSIKNNEIIQLKDRVVKQNFIVVKQNSVIDSLTSALSILIVLPKEKYNPEIDKFLNIEDTSIFNNKFRIFNDLEIHKRSKSDYLLIQNIHILNGLLSNIEKNIFDIDKINKSLVDIPNIPQTTLNSLIQKSKQLNESVKNDLTAADKMIEQIDKMDRKDLSDSQQQYYRPFLVDKYNGFLRKIYPPN